MQLGFILEGLSFTSHSLGGGAMGQWHKPRESDPGNKTCCRREITEMCCFGALSFAGSLPLFIFSLLSLGTGCTSLFTPLTGTVSVKVNK